MTSGTAQQIVDDPVRGRRTVFVGADGLPERVEFADGVEVLVDRDDGQLVLTGSDGVRLARLRVDSGRGGEQVWAEDTTAVTAAGVSESQIRIERGGAVLRIDVDEDGRPLRVAIPGLPDELRYRPIGAGVWEVGPAHGTAQIQIVASPGQTHVEFGNGCGWTESVRLGQILVTSTAGLPVVAIDLDHSGRITARRWHGGSQCEYVRDDAHRLVGWRTERDGVSTRAERRYRGDNLSELVADGRRTVVKTDDGQRITKLVSVGGTARFGYDAAGRRVSREHRDGGTAYRYDMFGQLIAVSSAEGETRYGWDVLGRRVWVQHNGARLYEHRDLQGRLWSVTDGDGKLVHAFIWWEGRVLARCGADGLIDETYLTDPVGTVMGIANPRSDWCIRDAVQPPFGAVTGPWRPTLFGHIADGYTPLICFGARDLDTETGMFLTPDPWHGDADDPRLIGGAPATTLARSAEVPLSGIHPYLLSQGDPVSRPDVDGHWSGWTHVLVMLLLSPTWGFPLTSVSSFFFMPINIYMELFGAVIMGFKKAFGDGQHPWPQHSIFNMRVLSGSSHLHTLALALNGLLPRASTGLGGDRCVTVGHVVWENRQYFNMLDRPRVLELDDIRGTPKPDGTPSADGRRFVDTAAGSVLAITSTDKHNSNWIHGTWWTRGPGNAVGLRGADQSFEDRRVGTGAGPVRGTVMLAQPLPEIMDGRLSVEEYKVTGTSTGVVAHNNWFAYQIDAKAGMKPDTVVELHQAGTIVPACGKVIRIATGPRPIAILDHEPLRFVGSPRPTKNLRLRKLKASTTTSANWQAVAGGVANKTLELAAPGHPVAVDEVYEMSPATPPPATPERPKAYSRIAKVAVTLELTPTISGLAVAGASLTRMTSDGTASNGNIPDPTGHPDQFTIAGAHKFVVGDLVSVLPTGATESHHGRITNIVAATPAVPAAGGTPAKPAEPAKLTIDPPFSLTAAAAVRITRLKEINAKLDVGTNASNPSGDLLRCQVQTSAIFAKDHVVKIDIGGTAHVRRVKAVTNVDIETHDEYVGTGNFALTRYVTDGSMIGTANAAKRFVKHTTGALPSAYGNWPAELMGLVPSAYPAERAPRGWRFFLRSTPPNIHRDFKDFWEPFKLGTDEYWLLATELNIVEDGAKLQWEPDPDDTYPRRHRQVVTAPITLNVKQFATTTVKRPDAGGGPVRALKAEAQVPDTPRLRWSLADALAEHELCHTVQNAYFGPFLGALPLQHLLPALTKQDVFGDDPPSWLDFIEADRNMFELLSIGGIMQLVWSNLVVGPLNGELAALDYMKTKDFEDSVKVLNPINRLLIEALPAPDPGADEDWKATLGRFVVGMLDLRSWTPFTGFVPLLLPDSPRNFIEQQASRWSGDLYSTILTANDEFNVKTSFIGNDMSGANLTSQVGSSVRMMSYYSEPLSSNVVLDRCDAAGSPFTYLYEAVDGTDGRPESFLTMEATTDTWVPALLYEQVPGLGPAPTPVSIDVPAVTGAGTVTADFLKVPAGSVLRPRLRSIVPVPPAVIRAVGFYLVNAGPGKWRVNAYDAYAGTSDDPRTATALITFDSKVRLGSEDVAWSEPFASGTPPVSPPAALLDRFITESEPLTVVGRNTTTWKAEADAGITLTPRTGGRGWDLAVAAPPGGLTPPPRARVRIWAKVAKNDPELFDLLHADVPTLKDRRSYLDDDVWVPVRDFLVQINDLALPTPASFAAADAVEVDLPVKLAGRGSIVPSSNLIDFVRVKNIAPRGEQWRFRLKGRKAIEKTTKIPVDITFGTGTTAVKRSIDLTVDPNFTIDVTTAGAKYEATPTAALDMTINGGTVDFTEVGSPPAATRAHVDVTGRTVTVTVDAPSAARPAAPPRNYELVIKDGDGKLGVRTITIKD